MSASADVLAQAKVEIDLAAIPLGKNVGPFDDSSYIYNPEIPAYVKVRAGHYKMAWKTGIHPASHGR